MHEAGETGKNSQSANVRWDNLNFRQRSTPEEMKHFKTRMSKLLSEKFAAASFPGASHIFGSRAKACGKCSTGGDRY